MTDTQYSSRVGEYGDVTIGHVRFVSESLEKLSYNQWSKLVVLVDDPFEFFDDLKSDDCILLSHHVSP